MSRQIIPTTNDGGTTVAFRGLFSRKTSNLNAAFVRQIWPVTGTLSNFRVELDTAVAGGTGPAVFVVKQKSGGGSDVTAFTVSIPVGETVGIDPAVVAVTAGDLFHIEYDDSSTNPGFTDCWFTTRFDSTTPNESGYSGMGFTSGAPFTNYTGVFRACDEFVSTSTDAYTYAAAAGILAASFVAPCHNLAGQFTTGDTFTALVVKNGVEQDGTGGTVDTRNTINGPVTSNTSVGFPFSLPVARGDQLYVKVTGNKSTPYYALAWRFVSTVEGESQLAVANVKSDPSASAARYGALNQAAVNWASSVLDPLVGKSGVERFRLGDPFGAVSVLPGASKTRTLELMVDGAAPSGTATLLATNSLTLVSGMYPIDGTGEVSIAEGQTVGPWRHTPASTPTVTGTEYWTLVMFAESPLSEPADPTDPDVQATGYVEMCFGGSYRSWIRDRGTSRRHWFLGDCAGQVARDDCNDDAATAFYLGAGSPDPDILTLPKVRGLLPEYGLAHWFDGVQSAVTFEDPEVIGGNAANVGGDFSFGALVRPATAGMGLTRCILHTGSGAGYLGLTTDDTVVFGVHGGTQLESAEVVVAERDYLVVGTYDGTEARLYVAELIATDPPVMNGPLGMTFTSAHSPGHIGMNDFADYFVGALQGVFLVNEALVHGDVVDLHETTFWTDVTDDVEVVEPLTIEQGIHGDTALDRIAGPGRLSLVIDNSHLNSGGVLGYYSPDHANVRDGFTEGIPIRVAFPDPGSPDHLRVQFIGAIQTIRMIAGEYRERRTYIQATDWIDEASRAFITGLETAANMRADELLRLLIDGMQNRPHAISFDEGTDTIPFAFHNVGEKATVLSEIVKVTMSEFGLAAVRWDGTLRFEARSFRSSNTSVEHTITDAIDVEPERSTDQHKNVVKVTVHPATVGDDPLSTLYEADATSSPADPAVTIPVGQAAEFTFNFQDPNQPDAQIGATEVIEPIATTDYLLNTAADGGGTDVTGNVAIDLTWTIESNRLRLNITNSYGDPVYLTYLRVRGRPVFAYNEVTLEERDPDSVARKGVRELLIDMPYQADTGVGLGLAQYLRSTFADVATRIARVTFKMVESSTHRDAGIQADVSSRVALSEIVSGVDGEYFIQGRRVEWHGPVADPDGNTIDNIDITWFPVPASSGGGGYWILETSTLDESTVLGF